MSGLFQLFSPNTGKNTLSSSHMVGFEDVLYAIQHPDQLYLINTLPRDKQECLITATLSPDKEERLINDILSSYKANTKKIIIYGENGCDNTIYERYVQLQKLGIEPVYLYLGGLFEWVLLRDVYGSALFSMTKEPGDLLTFRACPKLNA